MSEKEDYSKLLEEIKVIRNRLDAVQGLIVKKMEDEMSVKMKKFDKVKK